MYLHENAWDFCMTCLPKTFYRFCPDITDLVAKSPPPCWTCVRNADGKKCTEDTTWTDHWALSLAPVCRKISVNDVSAKVFQRQHSKCASTMWAVPCTAPIFFRCTAWTVHEGPATEEHGELCWICCSRISSKQRHNLTLKGDWLSGRSARFRRVTRLQRETGAGASLRRFQCPASLHNAHQLRIPRTALESMCATLISSYENARMECALQCFSRRRRLVAECPQSYQTTSVHELATVNRVDLASGCIPAQGPERNVKWEHVSNTLIPFSCVSATGRWLRYELFALWPWVGSVMQMQWQHYMLPWAPFQQERLRNYV